MTDTEKLSELAKGLGFKYRRGVSMPWDKQDEWQQRATGWRCQISYQGRRYSFDYWKGAGHGTTPPTVDDCLDCLLSDASLGDNDFDDFCSELDYDTDSRKAHRSWMACQRVNRAIRRLLGDDYERFMYADRD